MLTLLEKGQTLIEKHGEQYWYKILREELHTAKLPIDDPKTKPLELVIRENQKSSILSQNRLVNMKFENDISKLERLLPSENPERLEVKGVSKASSEIKYAK